MYIMSDEWLIIFECISRYNVCNSIIGISSLYIRVVAPDVKPLITFFCGRCWDLFVS